MKTDDEKVAKAVERLSVFDIETLKEIHTPGSQAEFVWSAAETMTVETLRNLKMISGFSVFEITDLGRKLLKAWKVIELAEFRFGGIEDAKHWFSTGIIEGFMDGATPAKIVADGHVDELIAETSKRIDEFNESVARDYQAMKKEIEDKPEMTADERQILAAFMVSLVNRDDDE